MANKHDDRNKKLGLKIAYYRKLKGFSQEEFAEMVGISRSHISAIESPKAKRMVSLNRLYDMADALEMPIYKLFQFEDE